MNTETPLFIAALTAEQWDYILTALAISDKREAYKVLYRGLSKRARAAVDTYSWAEVEKLLNRTRESTK